MMSKDNPYSFYRVRVIYLKTNFYFLPQLFLVY